MRKIKNILSKIGMFELVKNLVKKPLYAYKSRVFIKYADEVFKKCVESFTEIDIPYSLAFGTLLGAVRENNFIKHDLDIDFFLRLCDQNSKIEEIFLKKGFKKEKEIYIKGTNIKLYESFNYRQKFSVDLYYLEEREEKYYHYEFYREKNLSYDESIKKNGGLNVGIVEFPKFRFIEHSFRNLRIFIPENSSEILKIMYGDYKIPKKEYNFIEENKAIKLDESLRGIVKEG